MLDDFRHIDYTDLGSAPAAVRYTLLTLLLIVILVAGYYLLVSDKWDELERVKQQEFALRSDFENKQQKAANLEAYEAQLDEMRELLKTMFRQLPSKTEMDKLLVDVSQTALAAGIDVQLFQPLAESPRDFYAERPISIRMLGDYHQFGDFVSGVASLPRVVILTMHDISLRKATGRDAGSGRLVLEGQVKTYRYIDENEAEDMAPEAAP
jgi:type IV pilus assembly protein PilO